MRAPPPLLLALVFFAAQLIFGLLEVNGKVAALPVWYGAAALVTGGLGVLGAELMRWAQPERPYPTRVLLIGLSWAIPFTSFMVNRDLLKGEFSWFSIPLLLGLGTLLYGPVMAALQNRTRPS